MMRHLNRSLILVTIALATFACNKPQPPKTDTTAKPLPADVEKVVRSLA